MSKRLKRYAPVLHVLSKVDHPTRRQMINSAPHDLIHTVSEICHNYLASRVNLSSKQNSSLKRHKNSIRALARKNTPLAVKRKHIQTAGFLGALFGPLLPLLGK